VGLTPPPNDIGHATNPGQGCFDDKEGDDSVDFVFYEALIDQLKGELCYDENRVFAVGDSSGAWLANELGCKYAGNTEGYAIRGVAAHAGGLPTEPQYTPTCSDKPMAGIWAWRNPDNTAPFSLYDYAVNRAMQINGCQAANLASAPSVPYPIGPNADATVCKQITGCPAQYPIVTCILPQGILTDDRFANPAFATFVQSFAAP
jgi:hypothetical protein